MNKINICKPSIMGAGLLQAALFGASALYGAPNVNLVINRDVFNRSILKPVTKKSSISNVLGGYQVNSNTSTTYCGYFNFMPNSSQAEMYLMVEGTMDASSAACIENASVYANSRTILHGSKHLWLDKAGVKMAPAFATACTTAQLTNVVVNSDYPNIDANYVWSQVEGQLPQFSTEIAQVAANRFSTAMDKRSPEIKSKLDPQQIFAGIENQSIRDFFLDAFHYATTSQFLQVYGDVAAEEGVKRGTKIDVAGRALPGDTDLGLQVHQSLVNNLSKILVGAHLTSADLISKFQFNQSPVQTIDQDIEALSFTFASDSPIHLAMDKDRADFTIHLSSIALGKQVTGPATIHMAYSAHVENHQIVCAQVERPRIEFAAGAQSQQGQAQQSPQNDVVAATAMKLLDKLLPQQRTWSSLSDLRVVQDTSNNDMTKDLQFDAVAMHDGWLDVTMKFADVQQGSSAQQGSPQIHQGSPAQQPTQQPTQQPAQQPAQQPTQQPAQQPPQQGGHPLS